MRKKSKTTESPRPEPDHSPAAEFFRSYLIPENEIPSLVAISPGGGPEEWDRIADDWRRDRVPPELRPDHAPLDVAKLRADVATLRASIKLFRTWWVESPQDFVNLYPILRDWWNTARLIEDMPPPPSIPIGPSLSGRVAGDVQIALGAADALLTWCGPNAPEYPAATAGSQGMAVAGKLATKARKRRAKKAEAEAAIRVYIAERQNYYDSLKPRCQQNDAAAIKQAEKTFARNTLVKELHLSAGMVSTTTAWAKIKTDLFLAAPDDGLAKLHSGQKVGFAIAEESAGQAAGDTTFDAVVRNETLDLIHKANMDGATEQQLICQLQAGDLNDTAAREMVDDYREGEAERLADLKAEHKGRRKTRHSDR